MTLADIIDKWSPGNGETPDSAISYISPIGGFVVGQIDTNHEPVELTHFACWEGHEDDDTHLEPDQQDAADQQFLHYLLLKWGMEHRIPRLLALSKSTAVRAPMSDATWSAVARIWADAGYVVALGDFGIEVHDNPLSSDEKRELLNLKAKAPPASRHNARDATEAALAVYGSTHDRGAYGLCETGEPSCSLEDGVRQAFESGGAILDIAPDGDAALLLDHDSDLEPDDQANGLHAFAAEHDVDLADLEQRLRTHGGDDRDFEQELESRLVRAGFLVHRGPDRFEAHRFPEYVHDAIRAMAGVPRSTRIDGSPHEVTIHECSSGRSCAQVCTRYEVVNLGRPWNGWASPTFAPSVAVDVLGRYGQVVMRNGSLCVDSEDGDLAFDPDTDGNFPMGSMFQFQVLPDAWSTGYRNDGWPHDPQHLQDV